MIENGEIGTGRGQNQETSLKRPCDTRWGSHYVTVIRLANMWQSVTEVLENVLVDGEEYETRGKAVGLVQKMETFEFVFILMLMKHLLGVIQPLSCALQQRDQDILNAIFLIENVKESLRSFREFGWDAFLQEVNDFCGANDISITNMDDDAPKRISKRNGSNIKNYHHYRVEIFCQVVDLLAQEMENHFSEASTDLLSCMACLDQKNDFAAFNVHKLVHLVTLYSKDFTSTQHTELFKQLETFVDVVRRDARLNGIEDLASLSQKIVETKKDKVFSLVYRLIELVLILPVATASVERVFSAMKFVKTDLRNRMGDAWLNDSLVVYNERSIFASVSNERILKRFQDMDTRRNQLSRLTYARAT
ncbi:uncharacterized protein LOC121784086 [Salvia splendens]|uniref:uncharacterized protein LOC121784086 n=1 Tax=Salvia splendens TaxID=180675 RepID=UPI001C256A92|nr:uncharacterized protein LOC121784086 [Salvia splendens]